MDVVSTLFHEYLEQYTDDGGPHVLLPEFRQGARVFEEQVWGADNGGGIFGTEGGKRAIQRVSGKQPFRYDEAGYPIYIIDKNVIPNTPK